MYKKALRFFLMFCVTTFLCGVSCENFGEWGIYVKNNSEKDVYFVLGFDWINNGHYPTIQFPNDPTRCWRVKPHQKIFLIHTPSDVKIKSNDSIALFVFDPDTVAKYTWEQLGTGEKYLKKYVFIGAELSASPNNYIAYP